MICKGPSGISTGAFYVWGLVPATQLTKYEFKIKWDQAFAMSNKKGPRGDSSAGLWGERLPGFPGDLTGQLLLSGLSIRIGAIINLVQMYKKFFKKAAKLDIFYRPG